MSFARFFAVGLILLAGCAMRPAAEAPALSPAANAEKLNGKTVIVTGTYQKKKGVEIKERHIVKVATLKAADEK